MKKGLKIFIVAMSLVLVIATAVGTSLALLTDRTAPIENTFTVGNVDIELSESNNTYKLIPGNDIAKDPTVTVKSGSENCWLFVKVEVDTDLAKVIEYTLDGWTAVPDVANVYYKKDATVGSYAVLTDNIVKVKLAATSAEIAAAKDKKMIITAYACQSENVTTVAQAWDAVKGLPNP